MYIALKAQLSGKPQDLFGDILVDSYEDMKMQSLVLIRSNMEGGSILQHTSSLFPSGSSTNTITSPCPALMVSTVNLAGCFTMFPVGSIPVRSLDSKY